MNPVTPQPSTRPVRRFPILAAAILATLVLLLAACASPIAQPFPPLLLSGQPSSPTAVATAPVEASDLALADPLPLDPAVTTGQLPNGLTYYVQRNTEPSHRADLWLVVDAGSVLEDEDQLGLAHFLEHMLFNGTQSFPGQALIDYLERTGMEFGPDINAYTSFDETVYMLQVPTDDAEIFTTGFDVLAEWASRATLDPAEIDAERGVVVEEWRLRDQTAQGRLLQKTLPALLGDSHYARRLPIGDMDIVRTAPPAAVERFYRTWYRPDLMAVIAVGDFDPAAAEALIRQRFSSLAMPTSPVPRPTFDVAAAAEPGYLVATDPEYPYTEVQISFKRPYTPALAVADFRDYLVDSLFGQMLNDRLDELSRQPGAPFVYAYLASDQIVRPLGEVFLTAQVQDDGVLAGLDALVTELERVRRHGFTETELARGRESLLEAYRLFREDEQNLHSSAFADGYANHFLTGEASPSIALMEGLARRFLPEITLAEVNAALPELLAEEGRAVIVTAPEKDDTAAPTAADLAAAFASAAARPVEPYVDALAGDTLMASIPAPAAIVQETAIPELGVTLLDLANGIRVAVKPTDFSENEIYVLGSSDGGTSLVTDADYPEAAMAASIAAESGVAAFTPTDLRKLLAGQAVGAQTSLSELSEDVFGYAAPADLETLFQLIHLLLTQPRFDPDAYAIVLDQQRAFIANRELSPEAALQDAITQGLYGDSIRYNQLPLEELEAVDVERAREIYQERFADMGDALFTVVGNVDVEQLRPLLETYLGTLPTAGRRETWRDVTPPPLAEVVEDAVYKGQDERSLVQLVYTGPITPTVEKEAQLAVLEAILNIRLIAELREALSGTYAPSASTWLTYEPEGEYGVAINFGTDPQRVDELLGETFAIVDELRTAGPSAVDVAKAQEQIRRNREEQEEDNFFWLQQLSDHLGDPTRDPLDILAFDAAVQAVTLADIRALATEALPPDRYLQAVLYPESYAPQ